MKDKKFTTIRITLTALMASMCAALGFVAIDMGNIKITFESLPVLVSGFMFGPVDGMLSGAIGTFVYQIVKYGFTPTTVLWILPYAVCGLFVGTIAKKSDYSNSRKQLRVTIFIAELIILVINTGALIVDGKIFGYFTPAFILGALPIRILVCIAKGILFGIIVPKILISFTRVTGNGLDKIKEYRK